MKPYPNADWNDWRDEWRNDPERARERFVCVQSVYCDDEGMLWILDPGNPKFGGVVENGAKLIQVDPK
jgi:hypothetical protein